MLSDKAFAKLGEDKRKLYQALRDNVDSDAAILMDPQTTTFVGSESNTTIKKDVISAIRRVPCHY